MGDQHNYDLNFDHEHVQFDNLNLNDLDVAFDDQHIHDLDLQFYDQHLHDLYQPFDLYDLYVAAPAVPQGQRDSGDALRQDGLGDSVTDDSARPGGGIRRRCGRGYER